MSAEKNAADNRAVGAIAATASTAALACGVCCILPLAIPAVMLATFGGVISWFEHAQSRLTPVAVACVIGGWAWVAIQSSRAGRQPAASTLWKMAFATLATALSYLWPMFEAPIERLLK